MKKLKILITNDDGVKSPGLKAAIEAVYDIGDIVVISPSYQQTSMSRSIVCGDFVLSIEDIVLSNGNRVKAYHSNSSPAFLVSYALSTLFLDSKPDLVISGINYGANLGSNITISATVGAAIQGACEGIPSIAISQETDSDQHFEYSEIDWSLAKEKLSFFSKLFIREKFEDVNVLKIDIPQNVPLNTEHIITRQSKQPYFIPVYSKNNKEGEHKIPLRINDEKNQMERDSDIFVVKYERKVSVTPISIDLTSRINLGELFKGV